MTAPVLSLASVIERLGRDEPARLKEPLPHTTDPELGRITAAVAHEINNPLARLLTATQTLGVHGGSEETRKRTLDRLRRGLNQIQTTVAALLPQARVEGRALEIDDFADVVTLAHPDVSHRDVKPTTAIDVESATCEAVVRLEPLALGIDQADQRYRHIADSLSGTHQRIELGLAWRVQHVQRAKAREPGCFDSLIGRRVQVGNAKPPDGFIQRHCCESRGP